MLLCYTIYVNLFQCISFVYFLLIIDKKQSENRLLKLKELLFFFENQLFLEIITDKKEQTVNQNSDHNGKSRVYRLKVMNSERSKECGNQCPWNTDAIISDKFFKKISFFLKYPEFIDKKI